MGKPTPFVMKLESAAQQIIHVLPSLHCQEVNDNDVARTIGQIIYEIPHIPSGLVSTKIIDPHGFRSTKYTPEHFWSRQRSGLEILTAYKAEDLHLEKLCGMLKTFCMVHYVSFQENMNLVSVQTNYRELPWEEQYKMVGIELVPDKGTAPAGYWDNYHIDGKLYSNLHEASESLRLDFKTIRNRCNDKKTYKWSYWKRIKKEDIL